MKLKQLNLIALLCTWPLHSYAATEQQTIANEMAYAVMANRCGDSQQQAIAVSFESGILMAINKSKLNKHQVLAIVNQADTLQQADRIIGQLDAQLKSGQQTCNALLAHVLDGIMPRYIAQQK